MVMFESSYSAFLFSLVYFTIISVLGILCNAKEIFSPRSLTFWI